MARFPFNDLHSFKDYIGFVKLCAPDSFPPREGVAPDEQWSLDLAFRGLREGLILATAEKGAHLVFSECEALVDEAYKAYSANQVREGYLKLDEVYKRLKKIQTY